MDWYGYLDKALASAGIVDDVTGVRLLFAATVAAAIIGAALILALPRGAYLPPNDRRDPKPPPSPPWVGCALFDTGACELCVTEPDLFADRKCVLCETARRLPGRPS